MSRPLVTRDTVQRARRWLSLESTWKPEDTPAWLEWLALELRGGKNEGVCNHFVPYGTRYRGSPCESSMKRLKKALNDNMVN